MTTIRLPSAFYDYPDFDNRAYESADRKNYPTARYRRPFSEVLFSSTEDASDRTLLENLLYLVSPDCDVEQITSNLLEQFGSFSKIIATPLPRLLEIPGMPITGASALKLVRAAALRMAKTNIEGKPLIEICGDVVEYLTALLRYEAKEQFRILFLDAHYHLISDELIAEGTVNRVVVYIREIVERIFELKAVAIILVHNHPSGRLTPSRDDLEVTRKIQDICDAIGVALHDHIIIANERSIRLSQIGVLRKSFIKNKTKKGAP